jgi:hypothetical protein
VVLNAKSISTYKIQIELPSSISFKLLHQSEPVIQAIKAESISISTIDNLPGKDVILFFRSKLGKSQADRL